MASIDTNNLFSVKGKTALITGASSGLGEHFAHLLAKSGANVIVAARRIDRLNQVVDDVSKLHSTNPEAGKAAAIALDVTAGEAAIAGAVEEAWGKFGRIDILVNNAGVFLAGPALDLPESDWDTTFNINVKAVWMICKEVAKKMAADGQGGSIVNIASCVGNPGGVMPGQSIYATSKATVQHLTKHLALELGRSKIRVNSLSPGVFPSEMTGGILPLLEPYFAKSHPLGRAGDTARDLDGPLLLLVSEAGAYVTGANITVDGGSSIILVPLIEG